MTVSILTPEITEQLESGAPRLVYAVEILYNNIIRAHTGVGDLVIGGNLYMGIGQLGEIGTVTDESSSSPAELTLQVSGLDATLVQSVINERSNNKAVRIYLVSMDADARATSSTLIFSGRTVMQSLAYDRDRVAVEVRVADRFVDWSRKATERFSDESHRSSTNSIGDRFFRFITQMEQRPIYWGSDKDGPGFRY